MLVSGRVHGVFFRERIVQDARELGLTGWVKNTSEGKVEAVFEGEENKIREILLFCKEGPRLAEIENVEVKYLSATGEFEKFTRR